MFLSPEILVYFFANLAILPFIFLIFSLLFVFTLPINAGSLPDWLDPQVFSLPTRPVFRYQAVCRLFFWNERTLANRDTPMASFIHSLHVALVLVLVAKKDKPLLD